MARSDGLPTRRQLEVWRWLRDVGKTTERRARAEGVSRRTLDALVDLGYAERRHYPQPVARDSYDVWRPL